MVRRNGASAISDICRLFSWPLRRADSCRNDAGAPSRSFRSDRTAGMEISCRTFLGDERIDRAGRTRIRGSSRIIHRLAFKIYDIILEALRYRSVAICQMILLLGISGLTSAMMRITWTTTIRSVHLVIRLFAQRSRRLNISETTDWFGGKFSENSEKIR